MTASDSLRTNTSSSMQYTTVVFKLLLVHFLQLKVYY